MKYEIKSTMKVNGVSKIGFYKNGTLLKSSNLPCVIEAAAKEEFAKMNKLGLKVNFVNKMPHIIKL